MKNLLIIIGLVLATSAVTAQTNTVDKRLLAKYSVAELKEIETNSPDEYKFLNYCLDNAWYLQALPKEKMKDGRIGNIAIKDIKNINFFALNIDIIKNDYQFFAIEGTDQMLVVKSKDHLIKELNK